MESEHSLNVAMLTYFRAIGLLIHDQESRIRGTIWYYYSTVTKRGDQAEKTAFNPSFVFSLPLFW